jgi:hypothetical protein
MWQEKCFNYGEKREVSLMIASEDGETTEPSNPTWELTDYETGVVESSGDCTMTAVDGGVTLTALIEPKQISVYRLIFSFDYGVERRKPCMIIKIR